MSASPQQRSDGEVGTIRGSCDCVNVPIRTKYYNSVCVHSIAPIKSYLTLYIHEPQPEPQPQNPPHPITRKSHSSIIEKGPPCRSHPSIHPSSLSLFFSLIFQSCKIHDRCGELRLYRSKSIYLPTFEPGLIGGYV